MSDDASGDIKYTPVSKIKTGHYIVIDGEPCRVVDLSKSKPGKHGAAKARIVAVGVFDGVKRSIIKPVSDKIPVPMIHKKEGQVISVSGDSVEVMDSETYDVIVMPLPEDEAIRNKITEGTYVEYWIMVGKAKIVSLKKTR
ncbi:MAG: translation initiation factor IF-5A [Candidatus Njordarchaeia archaeon]|nr:translation initiation factor IF-5A [Candidatus Korarchaeota archaeon]